MSVINNVAPLAGSVDRNAAGATSGALWPVAPLAGSVVGTSLPSRGAWIEISRWAGKDRLASVAPLAGSVDRNRHHFRKRRLPRGRSPRGERG